MAEDPFVTGIGSALEGPTGRLVARTTHLGQPRPAPPRGVKRTGVASGNEITWEAPPPGTVFSHYCIRVDTDAGPPAMQVPASTTRQTFLSGTNYFVSTCLDSTGMESAGVKAEDGGTASTANGQWPGYLVVPGTLAISSQAAPLVKTEAAQSVRKIEALLKQAPVGGNLVIAINAPTLITTLTVTAGSTSGSVTGSWTLPASTVVSIDITDVGLTFPGADLTVIFRF